MEVELGCTSQQLEVINCRASEISLFAGRRFGKTIGVVRNRILKHCLSRPGFKYLFYAPSYAQVKGEFDALVGHPDVRDLIKRSPTQPFPKIIWRNGSETDFRSMERPHLIRSKGYDEAWGDEIQDLVEEAIDSVIRPLVADRRGTLGFSGQFAGLEGWQYKRLYVPGQDFSQENVRSFRFPTADGFQFQSEEGKAWLARQKSSLPKAVWEQEYECIPTANQKALFDPADLDASKKGKNSLPIGGRTYIIGLDLGRVADPSAIVVMDDSTAEVVHSELRPLGEKHEIGAQYAAQLSYRYNEATVVVDTTGGATGGHSKDNDEFVKFYRLALKDMRPMYFNRSSKTQLIDNLALAFQQRLIAVPGENFELHKQLSLYEFERAGDGGYIYHGPKGHRDDYVPALAMAYWGHIKGWGGKGSGVSLSAIG